ncbi:MAG: YaiI/YqxD family protein [Actinobacteria bacterium]|nr:MAG: YaiI/YqxD family protein [Actinomycetota bacterium]
MQIWVDADACPQVIKGILFRAAERAQVLTTLVANAPLRTPPSQFIKSVRVAKGFDVADHRIVKEMRPGDLVITADIPLAAEVIARGAHALDPRGELYSEDNVRERLAMRNLMQELRGAGAILGGPAPFDQTDSHLFANQLDRFLTRNRHA